MVANPKLTNVTSVRSQSSSRGQMRSRSPSTIRSFSIQGSSSRQKRFPLLLRILLWVQHTSSFVALGAIGISLGSYGLMAYTQQQWNQQYQQLQQLQQKQRHLKIINESLKEKIPSNPSKQKKLVPLTPEKILYVEPAEIGKFESESSPEASNNSQSLQMKRPLGY